MLCRTSYTLSMLHYTHSLYVNTIIVQCMLTHHIRFHYHMRCAGTHPNVLKPHTFNSAFQSNSFVTKRHSSSSLVSPVPSPPPEVWPTTTTSTSSSPNIDFDGGMLSPPMSALSMSPTRERDPSPWADDDSIRSESPQRKRSPDGVMPNQSTDIIVEVHAPEDLHRCVISVFIDEVCVHRRLERRSLISLFFNVCCDHCAADTIFCAQMMVKSVHCRDQSINCIHLSRNTTDTRIRSQVPHRYARGDHASDPA